MTITNYFSQHARRALSHARALGKQYSHPAIDTSHLLIGILQEDGSVGCNVLREFQIDPFHAETIMRVLHDSPGYSKSAAQIISPPFSTSLQQAITLASDESRWLGQYYIGTEHLLLGLARSEDALLLLLFQSLEIAPEHVRRNIRQLLQSGMTEISLEQAKRVSRLSELSKRVLNAAEQSAQEMSHKTVGLGHLLLVLAREQRGIGSQLLHEAGFDTAALEASLKKPRPATGGLLEDILDQAVAHADALGSHYTGSDHILLALATDSRSTKLLRRYGADPRYIAQKIREMLQK